jgi:hypothetical protein
MSTTPLLELEVAQPRRWRRSTDVIRYHFDPDGVRCDGPCGPTQDAWSTFTGYRATAGAYELMVGRRRRFVIPRAVLRTRPDGDAALASLLSAHLRRR